ncbi:hypothetical protein [Actinocatenispora rupis]|uniref:hypothetical protein n=1 Tax=Actinocatenispora rupis TaxID=519421 RepID=UPI00194108A0|nr:hypothetical protein [Actinocatenispora rupis]
MRAVAYSRAAGNPANDPEAVAPWALLAQHVGELVAQIEAAPDAERHLIRALIPAGMRAADALEQDDGVPGTNDVPRRVGRAAELRTTLLRHAEYWLGHDDYRTVGLRRAVHPNPGV